MDAFVEKYLLHAASHAENTLSGNYRKGNTAATELERMNQYLLKLEDTTAARSHIDEIICSDLPNAVMWIAPVCKEEQYKQTWLETSYSVIQKIRRWEFCR